MKKRRLFLAIPLPDEVQLILSSFANNSNKHFKDLILHRGFRWLAPQGRHITLLFIGWVLAEDVPEIQNRLRNLFSGNAPFTLAFDEYRFMPANRKATMLWAKYENNPDFDELHRNVKREFQPWLKDDTERQQIPHITLAKFKPAKIDETLSLNRHENAAPSIVIDRVELWESQLRSSGAEYSAIESYPFSHK